MRASMAETRFEVRLRVAPVGMIRMVELLPSAPRFVAGLDTAPPDRPGRGFVRRGRR